MCLARPMKKKEISQFKTEKEHGHNVGYKIFECGDGHLTPQHIGYKRIPVGKWLHEKDFEITSPGKAIGFGHTGQYYPMGFHIYVKHKEIRYETTRKVYFRQIVQRGYQDKVPVIVAKEMYVVPLKDIKPS